MARRATKRYRSFGLATAYTGVRENRFYTIRRKYKGEPRGGWVYVYDGRRKVFDCNPIFFRTWFREVKS